MTERHIYDLELGKITDQDREYARDLLEDDLPEELDPHMRIELVAQWFRKVCYEAVIADRDKRGPGERADAANGETK